MFKRKLQIAINEILASKGFNGSGNVWSKKSPETIEVVTLQLSKSRTEVTLNLGATEPLIYEKCWKETLPAKLDESLCIVTRRLGILKYGHDKWYSIAAEEATINSIVNDMQTVGLPFLQQLETINGLLSELEKGQEIKGTYPPTFIYLALIYSKLGKTEVAIDVIEKALSKLKRLSGGWSIRLKDIKRELTN